MMRMILTSSAHPPPALRSALDQTPPFHPCQISQTPRPAHASAMVSPDPASVSSSTAADPAADTPTRNPAAHLPMMSIFHDPPADKALLSATRRLSPFNREIEKTLACLQNLLLLRPDDAGHSLQQILGHICCTVDNRHHAGHDSRTVATSLAKFLNVKSCSCSTSKSYATGMDSGEGTGAEGTNGTHRPCVWGWKGIKGMRCYEEYTVHGGAEGLHNVMSSDGRELHYLLILENNRARLVRQYCAVLASFTVRSKVDRGCSNLFHHHDYASAV
jgi:hypothetical protein